MYNLTLSSQATIPKKRVKPITEIEEATQYDTSEIAEKNCLLNTYQKR